MTCAIPPQSAPSVADVADLTDAKFTEQRTGDDQEASPPHTPELVVCLSGQIECETNKQRYQLNPGDSLSFNGNVLHCWRNQGSGPAVAMMFLHAEAIPTLEHEGE